MQRCKYSIISLTYKTILFNIIVLLTENGFVTLTCEVSVLFGLFLEELLFFLEDFLSLFLGSA